MPHAHLADELASALGQAGWDEQILTRQWQKLAVNCAINPLTALYKLQERRIGRSAFCRCPAANLRGSG